MARPIVLKPVLYWLLVAALFAQFCLQLARIAVTYKALDIGLSPLHVGVISGLYAVFPAALAIPLGRFYDKGGIRLGMLAGSVVGVPVSLGTLLWEPASMGSLILGTILLGITQVVVQSGLQVEAIRTSGRHHRDRVIGNLMTIYGIGNMLGPLAIVVLAGMSVQMGNGLLLVCLGASVPLILALLRAVWRKRPEKPKDAPRMSILELARTPKLVPLVVLSGVYLTAQDLLLVFMPVYGVERSIDTGMIGVLLGIQATVSIGARACFGTLVAHVGRARLQIVMTAAAALSMAGIALPVDPLLTTIFLVGVGFSLPLALISSLALIVQVAPKGTQATALSMRYSANRVVQFLTPLAAGLIAVSMGAAGVFLALSILLALCSLGLWLLLART